MEKFKQLSYRKKNRILLIGFVLLLLVVYKLNISKTIGLLSENDRLNEQLAGADNTGEKLESLRLQSKQLNRKLKNYQFDSIVDQEYLLEVASKFCNDNQLKLRSFPGTVETRYNDFAFYTNTVEVQGDYINLLKLMHELEQNNPSGRLASATFEMKKDRRVRKENLILTLKFQKIKNLKS